MVAYSFQPRFAAPIEQGLKTHTLRAAGKRRHARVGEALQLYSYGQIAIAIGKGISANAVSWHCLRLGAELPRKTRLRPNYHLEQPVMKRGKHIVRAFTPAEDAQLTVLSLQGLGDTAIGRALGRRPNSVRGRLMTLARREERATP